jgi:hypothetical protein
MSDQTPTFAEVEALEQQWMASHAVSVKDHMAYDAARTAYDAAPDTQQILHEAIRARTEAAEEHTRRICAERAAYDAWADTCDAVDKAKAAHAKATR